MGRSPLRYRGDRRGHNFQKVSHLGNQIGYKEQTNEIVSPAVAQRAILSTPGLT